MQGGKAKPGLDGEELLRAAVARRPVATARELVVEAVRSVDDDVLAASRLALFASFLSFDLGSLSRRVRPTRVRAFAAAAQHSPWEASSPLLDRAEREAVSETDAVHRSRLLLDIVRGVASTDRGRAGRLVDKISDGATRAQALAELGRVDEALELAASVGDTDTRDQALSAIAGRILETSPDDLMRRGLIQKIADPKVRDRLLSDVVIRTQGIFLTQKISDLSLRAESLGRLSEWEEVDLVLAEIGDGLVRVNAFERLAAVAREGGDMRRAISFEDKAAQGRVALPPHEKAESLRLVALIASDLNKARAALVRASEVDWSEEADRDARIRTARLCLKFPSGPRVREAIAVSVGQGDVYAEVFPDIVRALSKAFSGRFPATLDAALLGIDWAERCAAAVFSGRSDGTSAALPTPLPEEVVATVSQSDWTERATFDDATDPTAGRGPSTQPEPEGPTVIRPVALQPSPIVLSVTRNSHAPTPPPPAPAQSLPPVFGVEPRDIEPLSDSAVESAEETTSVMRADQWLKLRDEARKLVAPSQPETAPRLEAAVPIEAIGDPNEMIRVDETAPESSSSRPGASGGVPAAALPASPFGPVSETQRSPGAASEVSPLQHYGPSADSTQASGQPISPAPSASKAPLLIVVVLAIIVGIGAAYYFGVHTKRKPAPVGAIDHPDVTVVTS